MRVVAPYRVEQIIVDANEADSLIPVNGRLLGSWNIVSCDSPELHLGVFEDFSGLGRYASDWYWGTIKLDISGCTRPLHDGRRDVGV